MSLWQLQTEVPGVGSLEKMTQRMVEKQVQTHYCHFPHPHFICFYVQQMVFDFVAPFIFSWHYKWIWGMPTMVEFRKCNARNIQMHTSSYTLRYSESQHCIVDLSLPTQTLYCVCNIQFQNSAQIILVLPSSESVVQKHSSWGLWPKLFSFCIFSASKIQSPIVHFQLEKGIIK